MKVGQKPLHWLVILTKFRDDSSKIVDFLLLVKFLSFPVFLDQSLWPLKNDLNVKKWAIIPLCLQSTIINNWQKLGNALLKKYALQT